VAKKKNIRHLTHFLLIASLAFCKALRASTFQNARMLTPLSGHNLLKLFRFHCGTTIALFKGACFDRMQEDFL